MLVQFRQLIQVIVHQRQVLTRTAISLQRCGIRGRKRNTAKSDGNRNKWLKPLSTRLGRRAIAAPDASSQASQLIIPGDMLGA